MSSLSQLANYQPSISEVEGLFLFPTNFSYTGGLPIRRSFSEEGPWAVGPVLTYPNSDLLADTNAEVLEAVLRAVVGPPVSERDDGCWEIIPVVHWGLGIVNHIAVKVHHDDGSLTTAARFVLGVLDYFRRFAVLDINRYKKQVRELGTAATVENIEEIGADWLIEDAPEDWAEKVFSYLVARDPREVAFDNEAGAEPSPRSIKKALKAMKLFEEGSDEDGDE